jgi:dTDP-3-amino-2,3,6-trideoxy-4-keto-D-glucose/dTDP-3-amino-3,4,6-trideoxy-alpha-D-glucose/dTDP-2,6-dideoxy-D-kanosamine transaminase
MHSTTFRPLSAIDVAGLAEEPAPATPIPMNDLARQHGLLGAEIESALRCVTAGARYVLGPQVTAFEEEFSRYCGLDHCIGVGNGSDALEIALRALGCRAGDEVITVPNAGMYSTAAVLALGARPVLVDIEPQSMTMDPAALAPALRPTTKAVIVTHLYGRLADVESIAAVLADREIPLLEDCAQAHGAELAGKKAGSVGAAGCFSFYPTKNLGALGDAGAIVTSDGRIAQAARELRQYGWEDKYHAIRPGGRNSRLDEIQAAVLRLKLPHLDAWNARRRGIAGRLRQAFGEARARPPAGLEDAGHLCVLRSRFRPALRAHLARDGIASDIHYPVPDHRQPALRHVFSADLYLPRAEEAAAQVLSVPCFPELTDDEIDRVCDSLRRFAQWESKQ